MQESNEALVQRIQAGERELLPRLWEQVYAFVRSEAGRWIRAWQWNRPGLELDDLCQCGYIALCGAVKTFQPDRDMSFIGWLDYYLKTEFAQEIGCRTPKQAKDKLFDSDRLERTVVSEDDDMTLGSTVADPEDLCQTVESNMYYQQLVETTEEALGTLPQKQKEAIRLRYFDGLTLEEAGRQIGVTLHTVQQREAQGLRNLRRCRYTSELREMWNT